MQLWQAHRALADAIGDTCNITSTSIPDGVRFSRNLRDSYLYRAMLTVLNSSISSLAGAPPEIKTGVLTGLFPNFIRWQNIALILGPTYYTGTINHPSGIVCIFNAFMTANSSANGQLLRLPIRNMYQKARFANDKMIQQSDPFLAYSTDRTGATVTIEVYDATRSTSGGVVSIQYLPYPTQPSAQQPTDDLDFEESFISKIITMATVFAMSDSQDLQSLDQYLMLQLGLQNGPQS